MSDSIALNLPDLLNFCNTGVSNCPGAPQLEFLFGRPLPVAASPDLLIPEPFGNMIYTLLAL